MHQMSRFFLRKVRGCIMAWVSRGALAPPELRVHPPDPAPLPKPKGPLDPRAAWEEVAGEWVWGGAQGSQERPCYTTAFEEAGSR